MPKVTIDGRETEVAEGLTIIRAAERMGIEVPHYCWHPGLTIAGNCRMCLVEIDKVPKLQIACNTRVTDGMVVSTRSERVKKAQASVLEFLLLNHPIDCPICDQAGECKLQDYYMDYDRKESRFAVEEKVRKRKVVDLGPTVVLDQERCILCLRCTRFLDEVAKTSELGVFERGDRAYIDLAPGQRLENPYSGNVVDICPVGALTSKDFRFKARVWYLKNTDSVCTFCANGCNIEIHHREGQIYRFRPRYNPDVNDYWMCDFGRIGYKRIQGEDRLLGAKVRQGEAFRDAAWTEALDTLAGRLREVANRHGGAAIAGIVAATASNEEAYLFGRLMAAVGSHRVAGHAWSPPGAYHDEFLVKADKNPNRRGLQALGIPTGEDAVEAILDDATAGSVKALVVFGGDLVGALGVAGGRALEALDFVALFALNRVETELYADLVLPIASFAETEGTFTNHAGRVQRVFQAFPPPGQAREGWAALRGAIAACGGACDWQSAGEVFASLALEAKPFAGMGYASLGRDGAALAAS